MKKNILMLAIASFLCSCGVQHFNVNTSDYGKNWEVFGENTKSKEVKKSGDFFIAGINMRQTDTKSLAEQMNATAYTIETKANLLSIVLPVATLGIVSYKRVKVIKR